MAVSSLIKVHFYSLAIILNINQKTNGHKKFFHDQSSQKNVQDMGFNLGVAYILVNQATVPELQINILKRH